MRTSICIALLSLFLSYCSADTIGPFDALGQYCNTSSTTLTSPISANIGRFLSEVVTSIGSDGFVTASYGSGQSLVYGLAQCRADVSSEDCTSCIKNAATQIRQLCPDQSDARIWYDNCFLRYDTNDFLGILDTSVGILYKNVDNVTDPKSFNKVLGALFDEIDAEAIKPESKGFAKGESKLTPFTTLYGLVQCTRDLSPDNCAQCLSAAIQNFEGYCSDSKGCRVLYSGCYVRYEEYPFFLPPESTKARSDTRKTTIYP
ncbi:hypothetical protein Ancab_019961 [Ancistrocladus abbreviatus]